MAAVCAGGPADCDFNSALCFKRDRHGVGFRFCALLQPLLADAVELRAEIGKMAKLAISVNVHPVLFKAWWILNRLFCEGLACRLR